MIQKLCQPKISNNCLKIFIQQNIGCFDITVDNFGVTLLMQIY